MQEKKGTAVYSIMVYPKINYGISLFIHTEKQQPFTKR